MNVSAIFIAHIANNANPINGLTYTATTGLKINPVVTNTN
jgi:hypothetical protein